MKLKNLCELEKIVEARLDSAGIQFIQYWVIIDRYNKDKPFIVRSGRDINNKDFPPKSARFPTLTKAKATIGKLRRLAEEVVQQLQEVIDNPTDRNLTLHWKAQWGTKRLFELLEEARQQQEKINNFEVAELTVKGN